MTAQIGNTGNRPVHTPNNTTQHNTNTNNTVLLFIVVVGMMGWLL